MIFLSSICLDKNVLKGNKISSQTSTEHIWAQERLGVLSDKVNKAVKLLNGKEKVRLDCVAKFLIVAKRADYGFKEKNYKNEENEKWLIP